MEVAVDEREDKEVWERYTKSENAFYAGYVELSEEFERKKEEYGDSWDADDEEWYKSTLESYQSKIEEDYASFKKRDELEQLGKRRDENPASWTEYDQMELDSKFIPFTRSFGVTDGEKEAAAEAAAKVKENLHKWKELGLGSEELLMTEGVKFVELLADRFEEEEAQGITFEMFKQECVRLDVKRHAEVSESNPAQMEKEYTEMAEKEINVLLQTTLSKEKKDEIIIKIRANFEAMKTDKEKLEEHCRVTMEMLAPKIEAELERRRVARGVGRLTLENVAKVAAAAEEEEEGEGVSLRCLFYTFRFEI
jgi:hypothetical protein